MTRQIGSISADACPRPNPRIIWAAKPQSLGRHPPRQIEGRMHILTGLLLAGLLGKNKFRHRTLMPMLRTGPVQTAHFVPGRVRLRVPSLADNAAGAALVREKLPTIHGVQSVKLNPATGSVLIVYREDEVRPELLFAAVVRLLNLDADLKRMPQPVVTRELKEILGSVNRMVYDRTGGLVDLWSAGLIVLAAIGIQRLLVQGMRAFPAGLTLVWWGLASLLGGRQS